MAKAAPDAPHVERPGPADFTHPSTHDEFRRAAVWLGLALAIVGVVVLAQPLMLIVGGLVFSVLLDGGTRLLGRILPVRRGARLTIVILLAVAFIGWTFWFAGTTLAAQAEALRAVVTAQFERVTGWASDVGLLPRGQRFDIGAQIAGSFGRLTSAVGTALGAVTSGLLIVVIGIFIAIEPRLYDRGVAWMMPVAQRERFYIISSRVGSTLRRLLAGRLVGMLFEGVFTFAMLSIGGVPMAALLGLLTGLLAFLPNIGAIVSGVLMVAVGFSAGNHQGLWAVFVYFFVQNVDGYLVVPYIARRTVDLAPALLLGAQLIMGALFGIVGLLLADTTLAAIKVSLEELSRMRAGEKPATPGDPIG